jgi:hypothetical protein
MGRWGNGEMGKWGIGEIAGLHDCMDTIGFVILNIVICNFFLSSYILTTASQPTTY